MEVPSRPYLPFYDDPRTSELSCWPLQAAPTVVKILLRRTYKSSFEEGKHVQGRDMIVRCIVSIYEGCRSNTAEAVDRVYRLLDTALYQRTYTVEIEEGETIVRPELPAVPNGTWAAADSSRSLVRNALRLRAGTLNSLQNETEDGFSQTTETVKTKLREILEALQSAGGGQLDDEMLGELVKIVALLA